MKNKKGWIRIVEAFISILLITGALLVVIDKGYIFKENISSEVYEVQLSILREIQLDDSLRSDVLASPVPVSWNDASFPSSINSKIISRTPDYLTCEAKICVIDEICALDTYPEKDIYAQSVAIISNLTNYNPRQLKMFCWI